MPLILGIDPGAHGALAVYDSESRRILRVARMPTWFQQIGKTKRPRIDALALAEMIDVFALSGVSLAILEAVGGYGKQPGSAAFVFGYGVGLIYMSLIYNRIPIETVSSAHWKALMNVPGKQKADDTAILARADEIFPDDRNFFRGKNGGKLIDVAEASMLARFGADFILKTIAKPTGDLLKDIGYASRVRNADTGA